MNQEGYPILVSIIIPHNNNKDILLDCLQSLYQSSYQNSYNSTIDYDDNYISLTDSKFKPPYTSSIDYLNTYINFTQSSYETSYDSTIDYMAIDYVNQSNDIYFSFVNYLNQLLHARFLGYDIWHTKRARITKLRKEYGYHGRSINFIWK